MTDAVKPVKVLYRQLCKSCEGIISEYDKCMDKKLFEELALESPEEFWCSSTSPVTYHQVLVKGRCRHC